MSPFWKAGRLGAARLRAACPGTACKASCCTLVLQAKTKGGRQKSVNLWRHYLRSITCLIYSVKISDLNRASERERWLFCGCGLCGYGDAGRARERLAVAFYMWETALKRFLFVWHHHFLVSFSPCNIRPNANVLSESKLLSALNLMRTENTTVCYCCHPHSKPPGGFIFGNWPLCAGFFAI